MRIISDFHDYYDTAMSMGQDQTRVFVRKTEDISQTSKARHNSAIDLRKPPDYYAFMTERLDYIKDQYYIKQPFLLMFCGKIYAGVKTIDRDSLCVTHVHYNTHEPGFRSFSNRHERALHQRKQQEDEKIKKTDREKIWVDESHLNDFIVHKDVIILAQYKLFFNGALEMIRNPKLKDLQFYKVMDAPTAFQEMDMFVSGILAAPDRKTETIDDKVRAQQHGFDKCSFRRCSDMDM
jgi:hypothetical protein